MTLKKGLVGQVRPGAAAALEVNGFLWVLGLNETQQWSSVRPTEDMVDVMIEGQASHLLVKGITCYIFAV